MELISALSKYAARLVTGSFQRHRGAAATRRSARNASLLQRAVVESLERRILFGYYSADQLDEQLAVAFSCPTCFQPAVPQIDAQQGQASPPVSGQPVVYSNGIPVIQETDLSSDALGLMWGESRSWTGTNNASLNGNGWTINDLPFLEVEGGTNGNSSGTGTTGGDWPVNGVWPGTEDDNRICLIAGGTQVYTFGFSTADPDTYTAWGSNQITLQRVSIGGGAYVMRLTDAQGNVTDFYDVNRDGSGVPISSSLADDVPDKYGRFKSTTMANGATTISSTYAGASDPDGVPEGVLKALTRSTSGSSSMERLVYSYSSVTNDLVTAASGTPATLISAVTLERSTNSGTSWTTIQDAEYEYYTGRLLVGGVWENDPNGRLGDLKLVTIKDFQKDPDDPEVLSQSYYRYYKVTGEGFDTVTSQGPTNQATTTGGPDPSYRPSGSPTYNPASLGVADRFTMSLLKTVVTGDSLKRLQAAYSDYQTESDATIQPYVNHYFQYERWGDHSDPNIDGAWRTTYRMGTRYRVTEEIAQGAGCSVCSGGAGTYKFSYTNNEQGYDYPFGVDPGDEGLGYNSIEYNVWRTKTIEELPDDTSTDWSDNNENIIYTNEVGQVMLSVFVDRNGTDSTSDDRTYSTFYRYDNQGRLIMKVDPSAIGAYDPTDWEANNGLLYGSGATSPYINDSSGLIELTGYYNQTTATSSSGGAVAGYQWYTALRNGELGGQENVTSITRSGSTATATVTGHGYSVGNIIVISGADQSEYDGSFVITAVTANTFSFTVSGTPSSGTGTIEVFRPILQDVETYYEQDVSGAKTHPVASDTVFANEDQTGARTTSYSYTWDGSTSQLQSMTVTLPAISASENGSGTANTEVTVYDSNGRVIWTQDANGYLTYTAYDQASGGITEYVADADPTLISSPPVTAPTRGSGLPTALNLVTSYEVDALGRTTKETDPDGNVTYTVYNDGDHEIRVYRGWTGTTTTGPIEITREYQDATPDGNGIGAVYTETLTSSATPTVSSGRPTGQEMIDASNILSLTRELTNAAGQVVENDGYYSFDGITYSQTSPRLGSSGSDSSAGNYTVSSTDYDGQGRVSREVSPAGTITRTLYDGMGHVVSVWVGTDDTPTSGYWSPTNLTGTNMVEVASYIYDDGGSGDGNLTRSIAYVDATHAIATDYFYDWRDRLVATKQGIALTLVSGVWTADTESTSDNTHPITYTTYDNLGEVLSTSTYDGDTVSISDSDSDGVPDQPSSSLLRAESSSSYDDQGRVYKNTQWSVDPTSGGTPTAGISSYQWFDGDGQVIKTLDTTGAVTKTAYDGAGRVTTTYTTDGGGDAAPGASGNYSDAGTVTGDTVLEQTEYQYDSDGNVIKTTLRQRNPDATATGALTTSNSRTTYTGAFYDAANRQIVSVDVGDNGGTVYTRSASDSVPTVADQSDTLHLTLYHYDDAGNIDSVTDPADLVSKTYYDALGRSTKTIANYVDGTPSSDDDQTTLYTYDGDNHVISVTADMPSGTNDQTTDYVYGITTGQGSAINSNDILQLVEYPDPSTGDASTSASGQNSFTYNALGQVTSETDQNGTVHNYSYDSLGRMTSDAVTVASGNPEHVDTSVLRIDTTYTSAGQVYQVKSYNGASGGTLVNLVQDSYDGLGNLIQETQSHDGTSTPNVQYGYNTLSTGTDNTDRIESLTYPNGRTINYLYTDPGDTNGVSNTISRITAISSSTTRGTSDANVIAGYSYMGAGTIVGRTDPNISMSFYDSGTGTYTGLDQFGNVSNSEWVNINNSSDIFHIQYGYDRDSNRSYAQDLIYTGQSQAYTYDGLNRLTVAQNGVLTSSLNSTSNGFFQNENNYTLDAQGNQTTDGTDESSSLTESTYNSLNQIDTRKVKGNVSNDGFTDKFSTDTSANWTKNGSGDAFDVNSTNAGYLTVTTVHQDTIDGTTEAESQAVLLLSANTGPVQSLSTNFVVPSGTSSGQVGIVFGYKSAADYWIEVLDFSDEFLKVYHVVNGAKGTVVASSNTWTSGTSRNIQFVTDGKSIGRPFWTDFPDGFPSGKIGLYTNIANTKFNDVSFWQEGTSTALTGRWTSYIPNAESVQGGSNFDMIDPTTDKLTLGGWASLISPEPVLLNNLTLARFQATFSVNYEGGAAMNFLFDAQGTDLRYIVGLQGDGSNVAVSLTGPDGSSISASSSSVGITSIGSSDTVWVRVELTGTTLVVKRIKSATAPTDGDWSSATDVYTYTGLDPIGGQFGFSANYGKTDIDNLTIKSDPDDNGTFDITELVDTFTLDSSGYDTGDNPTYDDNGNLTFDGTQVYTYDAWNRLVGVAHGYTDGSGDVQTGETFDTMSYDGLGRLITETISGEGSGHDQTYQNYYDGDQLIEQKTGDDDGSGPTIKQNVWGLQYVNELVQTAVNSNPSTDNTCDTTYTVLQDANWNVEGIVDSSGNLVERYAYTPYGQRTVYVSGGSADPGLYTPGSQSTRATADGSAATYGIMDFGFQGMLQDQATGLVVTSARVLNLTLNVWQQEEPAEGDYIDGTDLFRLELGNPTSRVDPLGLQTQPTNPIPPATTTAPAVAQVNYNLIGTPELVNQPKYFFQWKNIGQDVHKHYVQVVVTETTIQLPGQDPTFTRNQIVEPADARKTPVVEDGITVVNPGEGYDLQGRAFNPTCINVQEKVYVALYELAGPPGGSASGGYADIVIGGHKYPATINPVGGKVETTDEATAGKYVGGAAYVYLFVRHGDKWGAAINFVGLPAGSKTGFQAGPLGPSLGTGTGGITLPGSIIKAIINPTK